MGQTDPANNVLVYLPTPTESEWEWDMQAGEGCRLCNRAPDKLQRYI